MKKSRNTMKKRLAIIAATTACVLFGMIGTASATTLTIYPSNHPDHNVNMNNGTCTVDGQAGVVVTVPGYPGGEGCGVTSTIVYDTGQEVEEVRYDRER